MDDLFDSVETGLGDAVARFKTTASNFGTAYREFIAIPPKYRGADWQSVKSRADSVMGTIGTITGAIDTAYGWLKTAFGLNGLGFLPTIPWFGVAAVGAAISAMMAVYPYMVEGINKARYNEQIDAENIERIKRGEKPLEYYKTSPGIFGDISDIVKWLVIGGAAIFIVPKMLQRIKEGKTQ